MQLGCIYVNLNIVELLYYQIRFDCEEHILQRTPFNDKLERVKKGKKKKKKGLGIFSHACLSLSNCQSDASLFSSCLEVLRCNFLLYVRCRVIQLGLTEMGYIYTSQPLLSYSSGIYSFVLSLSESFVAKGRKQSENS